MRSKNTIVRFAACGVVFGLCFPILATLLDVLITQRELTLANIIAIQASQPLHWIIDTAPVFLGLVAGLVGLRQARVEQLNAELETRVDERTSELKLQIEQRRQIEKDLRQALVDAQTAMALKGEFMATMSHEIRTPLNGVIGMTGLLMETDLTTDQRDYAHTIRTSGEVLLGVINDILDFSKLEAGKVELEVIAFNLRSAVEDTIDLVTHQAADKQIELGFLIHHDVPEHLLGDPGRIRQVLLNLLSNAIKFTEQGEVLMTVAADKGAETRVELMIDVQDSGIGIPPERLGDLFAPFSQADASTTRKYGGTGLGLSIAKSLVTAMGGRIGVESEVGVGSRFWLRLPLEVERGQEVVRVQSSSLAGKRLLVVDDNEVNCRIFAHHLNHWGCEFELAGDGHTALTLMQDAASDQRFDLVLVDYQMPAMDGTMLAEEILRSPELNKTPLILITSIMMQGELHTVAEKGFAGYLTKPVKASHLFDCIALVLDKKANGTERRGLVTEHNLPNSARSRARILVAEDNLVNQKVAVRILQNAGYRCDVAANGLEAVEAMGMAPYDLILMDCQMPEMDGYAATQAIRALADPAVRSVPIVAMTANALNKDREACLAAGMDGYVSKPVRAELLVDVVDQHINGSRPIDLPRGD